MSDQKSMHDNIIFSLVLIGHLLTSCAFAAESHEDVLLHTVREYAEQYELIAQEDESVPTLPIPPEQVAIALQQLRTFQSTQHAPYIGLILLKLHRYYVEQFHQEYDLRTITNTGITIDNPILIEFCQLAEINIRRAQKKESMLSGMIVDWMYEHDSYRQYPPIQHEMQRIEEVDQKIERGEFWSSDDSE